MNFLDWLDKTREKPEGARRRITFLWTFVLVAIIIATWLSISFVSRKKGEESNASYRTPFSIVKDMTAQLKGN